MMRPPVRVTRASSAAAVRGSTSAHSITSLQRTQPKAPLRNGRGVTSAPSTRFGPALAQGTPPPPARARPQAPPRGHLGIAPGLRADVHRDDLGPALEQEERDDGVVVVVVAHDGALGHGAGSDALPAPDGDELVERPPRVAPRVDGPLDGAEHDVVHV